MDHLLIFGASTRAAAMSAIRAGYRPWCADLFADHDLKDICHVERIPGHLYPGGFVEIAKKAPPGPWMYTGGLENHPRLVAQISKTRRLLGTPANVLRKVRSPFHVAECLKRAGLPCPATSIRSDLAKGRWLVKPLKSSGGRGISGWDGQTLPPGHFLQEYIEGNSASATFVAHQGKAVFYGATRQLVGESWLHAADFHYCGSIGPLAGFDEAFKRVGQALAEDFGLEGIFGVDCVLRDGVPIVIEVNPRYTASVEVLERAGSTPALAVRAGEALVRPAGRVFAKGILFAPRRLRFPKNIDIPNLADTPEAGQIIEKGRPILTVFAEGDSFAECENNLRGRAGIVERVLFNA